MYEQLSCTDLWQGVRLRPLEIVRHRNYVCLHFQSCRQLSSEIVVFLNLGVVRIRKQEFDKTSLQALKMLAHSKIIFVSPGQTHWEAELEGSGECPATDERKLDNC